MLEDLVKLPDLPGSLVSCSAEELQRLAEELNVAKRTVEVWLSKPPKAGVGVPAEAARGWKKEAIYLIKQAEMEAARVKAEQARRRNHTPKPFLGKRWRLMLELVEALERWEGASVPVSVAARNLVEELRKNDRGET